MFAFRQISAAGIRTQQASLRFVTKGLCSNQPIQNRIADLVKENKIVLFMKGTPDSPMCGFSKAVVQILDIHDVSRQDLSTHNVLEDEEIRQGVKEYSSWPTIPQVYMNGDFVGGCDIMLDMHKSGELVEELKKIGIKSSLDEDSS